MLLPDLLKKSRNVPLKVKVVVRVGIAMVTTYCVLIFGAILYDQSTEPEYKSVARFKILPANTPEKYTLTDNLDFDAQIATMRSNEIIRRVIKRLTAEERRVTFAPYQKAGFFTGIPSEEEIFHRHRTIRPEGERFMVTVEYTHPDKDLGKKLVAYLGEEIRRDMEEKSFEKMLSTPNPVTERLRLEIQRIQKDILRLASEKKTLLAQNRPFAEIESIDLEIKKQEVLHNLVSQKYEVERSHRGSWMNSAPIRWLDSPSTDGHPVNTNLPRAIGMATAVATLINAALAFVTFRILRNTRKIAN